MQLFVNASHYQVPTLYNYIIDGIQSDCIPKIKSIRRTVTIPYDQPLNLLCQLEVPDHTVHYSWTICTEFEYDHLENSDKTLHRDRGRFLGGIYTCRAENLCGHDIAEYAVKIAGEL